MRWSTPWRVLIGDREAILEAAASRWTLLVGAVLVLSASLARKYDTVDLLDKPQELLHGIGATIVNTVALHSLIWLIAARAKRPPYFSSLLSFLGVFWLAAPMGWLYGIPYEQFMAAPDAVAANLWTLAVISVIRVVWVTRVLNVLWGVEPLPRGIGTFFLVMLYSDAVAIVALATFPVPTVDFMSQLQQPPEVQLVARVAFFARNIAVLSGPIWLIGGVAVLISGGRAWAASLPSQPTADIPSARPRAKWFALWLALAALLFWSSLLPIMQPPQQRRTSFERKMRSGQIQEAIRDLCSRARADYPPVWSPPPANDDGVHDELDISLAAVALALEAEPNAPEWVLDAYANKMIRRAGIVLLPEGWHESIFWVPPESLPESLVDPPDRTDVIRCLRFAQRHKKDLTSEEENRLSLWIEFIESQLPVPIKPDTPNR